MKIFFGDVSGYFFINKRALDDEIRVVHSRRSDFLSLFRSLFLSLSSSIAFI